MFARRWWLLASVLLASAGVRPADRRWGFGSAEDFCWVTGVVEDDQDATVRHRSCGGQEGWLATAGAYTVPSRKAPWVGRRPRGLCTVAAS